MLSKNPEKYTCTFHLVTGDPISFSAGSDEQHLRNLGSRIEHLMAANFIGIEIAGKLTIIPTHNIQKIEIDPAPPTLIQNVIKDVDFAPE